MLIFTRSGFAQQFSSAEPLRAPLRNTFDRPKTIMSKLNSVHDWLKESIFFYNKSLKEHVDMYNQNRSSFFYRQYKFAASYACQIKKPTIEDETQKAIEKQVLHLFASLPEKYDDLANEKEFAFTFCYLFANHLLGIIEQNMIWDVLNFITHNWDEIDSLIIVPDEIEW